MKFICALHLSCDGPKNQVEENQRVFDVACLRYDCRLRESGHLFFADRLQIAGYIVRRHSCYGQLVVEDGMNFHAAENLKGFLLLEARDLNHAIILVADHPVLREGWMETFSAVSKGDES